MKMAPFKTPTTISTVAAPVALDPLVFFVDARSGLMRVSMLIIHSEQTISRQTYEMSLSTEEVGLSEVPRSNLSPDVATMSLPSSSMRSDVMGFSYLRRVRSSVLAVSPAVISRCAVIVHGLFSNWSTV